MTLYQTRRWRTERAAFLNANPRCMCPTHKGRADAPLATDVDHITPHGGNTHLFWDQRNWQSMAERCHQSWKYQVESHSQKRTVHNRSPRTWLPPTHIPSRSTQDFYSPAKRDSK
jgi:hypothetical protein